MNTNAPQGENKNRHDENWRPMDHSQQLHPLKKIAPRQNKNVKEAIRVQLNELQLTHKKNGGQTRVKRLLQEASHAIHKVNAARREELSKQFSKDDALFLRAKLLIQAAGFLDIDRLVEYREPPKTFGLLNKGRTPQLQVDRWRTGSVPDFGAAKCAICGNTLRGISFRCNQDGCSQTPRLEPRDMICEDCFRNQKHRQDHLIKVPKHCILDRTVTIQVSRKLCPCTTVPRFDSDGCRAALWPVDPEAKHRRLQNSGHMRCGLFYLPGLIVDAKARLLQEATSDSKDLKSVIRETFKDLYKVRQPTVKRIRNVDEKLEDRLDADLPLAFRGIASKFPFGNTHIALMIGPLIIENGVPQ